MATFAGEVEVTVTPDTTGFGQRIEADTLAAATRAAQKIGQAMGQTIADRIANGVRQGLDRAGGAAAGRRIGAEFGRTFATTANAEIKKSLRDQQVRVRVVADTSKARAEIDRLGRETGLRARDGIASGISEGATRAAAKAPAAGDDWAGKYAKTLKARLESAFKALPDVKLDADSSAADRKIAGIREELQALSTRRIGVDISTAEAVAKVSELKVRLTRLSEEAPDIRVKVDAKAALADLAAVETGVKWVDGKVAKVRVDADTAVAQAQLAGVGAAASGSVPHVGMLTGSILLLGPALVPIAAASAGAFAGIAMGAMAAAGAVGVLALALWPVIQAVQAVTAAQSKQAQSSATSANRAVQLANATDALRSAEDGVAEAVRRGRQAREQSARAIERARQSERDAADAVLAAEQRLADARAEWAGDQADLQSRITQGALAQRQAALDLQRDAAAYQAARTDPGASAAEREQAEITYLQARQHLQDLRRENADLIAEQDRTTKAGVEGSRKVVAAQDDVSEARRRQKDAALATRDAVADAAESQRQSARAVAAAQQQVIQAQRALHQSSTQAGAAGSSAMQTMQDKLAALTPEGRRFVMFLTGPLKAALSGLSGAAQAGFLPGLQSGLQALIPSLPAVKSVVGDLAKTMGDLAAGAGRALAGPFWRDFFGWAATTMIPVLEMMGKTFGNFMTGLAGLFRAFAPAGMQFGQGLLGMSEAFAKFGRTADKNTGLQNFLRYVMGVGPKVADFFKQFAVAVVNIGRALAPIGDTVLAGLTGAFRYIAGMDPAILRVVAVAIMGIIAAVIALNAAMWLLSANPIVLLIAAIVAGIIVAIGVIAAWVIVFKKLYDANETFRRIVDTVWRGISAAISFTWNSVIKPAWAALVGFVRNSLIPAMLWLWRNVIVPVWQGISAAVAWAWENVISPLLKACWWFIRNVLAPVFTWLYRNVIQPVWQWISVAIQLAWSVIQVAFKAIEFYIRNVLAPVFLWLYHNVIRPVWENMIRPVLRAFADFIGTYIVPAFKAGVSAIARAWGAVRDAAKVPIEFVIEQVINRGIIDTWNRIAGWFGVDPVNHLSLPWSRGASRPTEGPGTGPGRAFAGGGPVWGPGSGTSDSIPAWLSNGEYVIPADIVRQVGVGFFDWIRSGRFDVAGDPSSLVIRAFADGGPVDGQRVAATRAWLPSVDPLPYTWGGVGPSGYDCSGLSGEVLNRVTGRPSYRRVFTTVSLLANPGRFGLRPGRGTLTFGVSDTHMDGSLAGLGFEARGRNAGILIGSSARDTGSFPHEFFLHDLGGSYGDAARLGIDPIHPIDSVRRMFGSVLAPLASLSGSAWGRLVSGMPHRAVDAALSKLSGVWGAREALQRIVPGYAEGGPVLYDGGGWLLPGMTTVLNASGSPEPVFSARQWDTLSAIGGTREPTPVHVTSQVSLDGEPFYAYTHRAVSDESARSAFRARVGRR